MSIKRVILIVAVGALIKTILSIITDDNVDNEYDADLNPSPPATNEW